MVFFKLLLYIFFTYKITHRYTLLLPNINELKLTLINFGIKIYDIYDHTKEKNTELIKNKYKIYIHLNTYNSKYKFMMY